MSQRVLLMCALSVFACLLLAAPATAQSTSAQSPSAPAADDSNDAGARTRALKWVDRFGAEQVLFSPGDVEKLREKVAKMTEAEAVAWWAKSATHRALFDSKDWQETRQWLREFLRVQAIYSDEQVDYFQSEAFAQAEQSPQSLKEVMDELSAKRKGRAAEHQSSEKMREQKLEYYQAYRQEQVAARQTAMKASAKRSASRPQSSTPVVKQREYHRTPPLVSSLDVARWSTIRSLWPRR